MLRRQLLLCTAAAGALASLQARAQVVSAAHVKARMAFNLARFTNWPDAAFADAVTPHLWCVAVRDATLANELTALRSESISGHGIRPVINPAALRQGCHVLFVEGDAEGGAAALLSEAAQRTVLSIGDGEAFSQRGMIGLVHVNDAIRFDINLTRLRAAGLTISAQVLKLARRVHE